MKLAFLFPGQGMETPRMGLALAHRSPEAKALLVHAASVTGVDVLRLLYRGGRDLARTEVLQPVLTAVSLGVFLQLGSAGIIPDYVAGHSLGEIAAWAATGCITPPDAVDLAAARGRLMAREAAKNPGGMLALFGGEEVVQRAMTLGQHEGFVEIGSHNAPEEWVLTGEHQALRAIAGAFHSTHLQLAGAWHGQSMTDAADELRRSLVSVPQRRAKARFVSNRTGKVAKQEAIPHLLSRQLVRPVQWAHAMDTLASEHVTDLITVGPGHVLRGLVRKNLGTRIRVHTTEDPDDLGRTVRQLSRHEPQARQRGVETPGSAVPEGKTP